MIMVAGRVQSTAELDVSTLVAKAYIELTGKSDIEPFVHIEQTGKEAFDRSTWVNKDAGIAYGFATRETVEQLPFALVLARRIEQRMRDARAIDPLCTWLGADGAIVVTTNKKQCTAIQIEIEYPEAMTIGDVKQVMFDRIIQPLLVEGDQTRVEIVGRLPAQSGFMYAPGATGVASESMTYAGLIPNASTSFAGKDIYAPARLAVYEARRLAKALLAKADAPNVLIQLPYSEERIGTDHVYAISGAGEDLSQIAQVESKRVEDFVQQFDLAKAPLRLLAEHNQFIPELAPWEISDDAL
jgi:S-adenosylmethionine synthetase